MKQPPFAHFENFTTFLDSGELRTPMAACMLCLRFDEREIPED